MESGDPVNIREDAAHPLRIDNDGKRCEVFEKLLRLMPRQKSPVLRARQNRAHFVTPEHRYEGGALFRFEMCKDFVRVFVHAAVETPPHRDRVIEHEVGHARP